MNDGFAFQLVGLPWWLVLPAAAIAGWGIGQLARRELAPLPSRAARTLSWLRRTAVVIILLFLLEPTLTRTSIERELPTVAVVIDRTGSMAVEDRFMAATARLDEAVALGLVPSELRPDAPRRVARALADAADAASDAAKAIAAQTEAWTRGTPASDNQAIRERITDIDRRFQALEPSAATLIDVPSDIAAIREALLGAVRQLAITGVGESVPDSMVKQLVDMAERGRNAAQRVDEAQRAADNALVSGAEATSPVARGLASLARLKRADRAAMLAEKTILPALRDRARIEVYELGDATGSDTGGLSLRSEAGQSGGTPNGSTDFAASLAWLSRHWTARHVGGIMLITDGRQTAGADPVPIIRALAARGAQVAGVLIGDPETPRDAVVAEVIGPAEIFPGEHLHLDVRLRITGYPERDFDLVLSHAGSELARRPLRGNGNWQAERFEVPWSDLGPEAAKNLHTFVARLEPHRDEEDRDGSEAVRVGTGLLREVWNGIGGTSLAAIREDPMPISRAPDGSSVVDRAAFADDRENYLARIRGWVMPPATGEYTFWISGDDQCELWISPTGDPDDRELLASVPQWTQADQWDKYTSQRSAPIALRAGEPCYIEVMHKQGHGNGHVAVGWQTPDNRVERPIPGSQLVPWNEGGREEVFGDPEPEASLANNQAECTVAVSEDPLRVLVIDEQPRWELRYLVAAFERDKRVELTRRYRSVRLSRGERELLPSDQAQLDAFDLVVLGDLAPGELTADDQVRLERFVSRRGGFLVAVAGPRGMPWGYSLGGLADLLPIRATGVASTDRRPVGVQLTAIGAAHPVTGILDDASLNQRLWLALPRLEWAATAVVAKPTAEVLVTTADESAVPIVALSRFGAGRVLWLGSDDCWRWRDRLGDRVHQTFWLQAMRWGLGVRLRGADRRLQAALDRGLIEPGQTVDLRVRALLADGSQAGAPSIALEKLDELGQPTPGSLSTPAMSPSGDSDLWTLRLPGLEEGRWRVTVQSNHPDLVGLREVRELVVRRRQGVEGLELGTDRGSLNRLANAGGSRAVGAAESHEFIVKWADRLEPRVTERRTTRSLWQNHVALIAVLCLLVIEWTMRKRRGLP